ncbi:MAG: hypothetical protein HYW88_01705 [Candidatus Sungbacteria bacterium]|nr:hypothetical protein [Candidatus Sungbacteria bacterium]
MKFFESFKSKQTKFTEKIAEDVMSDSIREAAPALFTLAHEIVEGGAVYDLVLSDDASGRLVSLFLKKVLDGVQKKHDLPKPDIRFVAGGQHNNTETFGAIKGLLEKIAPVRTLVVTEYISSGSSIKKLTRILQELNLKFDVAVLSAEDRGVRNVKDSLLADKDTQIYLGSKDSDIWRNFYSRDMSGVTKSGESPFPKKNITPHFTEEHKKEMQEKINQAREDISLLAQEALKELGIEK